MAERHSLMVRPWPVSLWAPVAVIATVLLALVPLGQLALTQGGGWQFDSYTLDVLAFTLGQATVSTVLSVVPALFVARAFARQRGWFARLLRVIFAVPLALPAIAAVLGLTAIYGTSGILGGAFPLYGFWGIVLAHVFYNLPLAARLFADQLEQTKPEMHRLGEQLGFKDREIWTTIDWPQLKPLLPRVAGLVFLLCSTSFVIVLTLGGASAVTLEVAIYQALRLDFDVGRAAGLAVLQLLLCLALVSAIGSFAVSSNTIPRQRLTFQRLDGRRLFDYAMLSFAALLVLPPLMGLLLYGAWRIELSSTLVRAFCTSMGIGLVSALLTITLAWVLSGLQAEPRFKRLALSASYAGLAVSPVILAMGWFLATRSLGGGIVIALALIVVLNALMALPFATGILAPAVAQVRQEQDRLADSLGLAGWARFRLAAWPALRPFILQAFLMAFVLSLGDLTAITLLGTSGLVTLPSLIAAQMGHFQSQAAMGTALLLAALCFVLAAATQRLGQLR